MRCTVFCVIKCAEEKHQTGNFENNVQLIPNIIKNGVLSACNTEILLFLFNTLMRLPAHPIAVLHIQ